MIAEPATLSRTESRILILLRDHGLKTSAEVGRALWGAPKSKRARLCWPAGRLRRNLRREGFVDREVVGTMFDHVGKWTITDAGRGWIRANTTGNE